MSDCAPCSSHHRPRRGRTLCLDLSPRSVGDTASLAGGKGRGALQASNDILVKWLDYRSAVGWIVLELHICELRIQNMMGRAIAQSSNKHTCQPSLMLQSNDATHSEKMAPCHPRSAVGHIFYGKAPIAFEATGTCTLPDYWQWALVGSICVS